jgi:hypothetical protein
MGMFRMPSSLVTVTIPSYEPEQVRGLNGRKANVVRGPFDVLGRPIESHEKRPRCGGLYDVFVLPAGPTLRLFDTEFECVTPPSEETIQMQAWLATLASGGNK